MTPSTNLSALFEVRVEDEMCTSEKKEVTSHQVKNYRHSVMITATDFHTLNADSSLLDET
jgi:hypothetical protein